MSALKIMLNSDKNDEVCDATEDDSSSKADYNKQKSQLSIGNKK